MTSWNGATLARMGLLALLWGSAFLLIKVALVHGLSPVQITFARCALGALVLLAMARAAGHRLPRGRRTWRRLAVAAALCNVVPFALFAIGERSVDSGVAGVLNATTPLWSLLIGVLIGTERGVRPVRLAGLLIGFAGTLLIFAPWQSYGLSGLGALALLGAALSYAVAFAYMGRRLAGYGTAPLALSAAQLVAATALTTPALAATGLPAGVDATGLIAVAALGVFGTGVTFALNYRLIADEGATTAATVGYLLPVVSVTLGAVVLDEPVGVRMMAGMITVLLGVALTRPRRRPPRTESAEVTRTARAGARPPLSRSEPAGEGG